jgi:protein SCO1
MSHARCVALALTLGTLVFSPLPAMAHTESSAVTVTRAPRQLGAPFSLIDQSGKRVGDSDFAGRLRLVYFGYTNCGDACPLDLQNIAGALDLLGERAREVAPIFITIDPARDTPQRLAEFLGLFRRDFIGLTGDAEDIRKLAAAYGVVYERIKVQGPDVYDLSHPAVAFIMGRRGEFLDLVRAGKPPGEIAAALRRQLVAPDMTSDTRH